jgi:DNA processing protein
MSRAGQERPDRPSDPLPWLRLTLTPEIGPVLAHRLLEVFGAPASVFTASPSDLQSIHRLGRARLQGLLDPSIARLADEEADRARRDGVRLVALDDPDYPPLLRRLPCAPLVLWVRGRIAPEDRMALAIVGPRSPSGYARLMSETLAPPLASHGLTLVSGLAHGIDAAVHRAALDADGRTLAVLGQGLGTPVFPEQNRDLARRIVAEDRGALISIVPMQTEPAAGLFPQRNEIIAGLALGTLIVEAGPTSGALITARHAAALGRTVLACPGDATRRAARGSNRLLADGAALVQTHEDVLDAIGPDLRNEMTALGRTEDPPDAVTGDPENDSNDPAPKPETPTKPLADPLDAALLDLLDAEPLAVDVLIERMSADGHAPPQVQQHLLMLELNGHVRQLPGRVYALAPGKR